MRKLYVYLLIMGIFVSCSEEQTDSKSTDYDQEFYAVLNDLIRMKLINTSVIQAATTPVSKGMWKEIAASWKVNVSFDEFNQATTGTYGIRAKKILDSAEIQFMYKAIDGTKTMQIDSVKVMVPIISAGEFNRIFNKKNRKDGYEVLRQTYGTSCIIKVSTPLFNSNYTKVILWIDYRCGWKHGQGYILILEKRKGKWWLIEDIGSWVS